MRAGSTLPAIMNRYYVASRVSPIRKLQLAVLAAVIIVAAGTVGLMYLESMPFLDALYMVIITLSTVGFGEIRELHAESRVFVMFLIVVGVLLGGFLVTIVGQMVLEGQFKEIVSRRKMENRIKRLSNHYIIAGFGRVGRHVAQEFQKRGVPFVVVEKEKDSLNKLESDGYLFVEGDATDEDILRQVNIEQAHTLVSTLPEEAQNVYLTLTARQMNARLKIIARADFEEGEKKLIRAGADHVVIPHVIGGMRMAMASLRPNVVDFMQIAAVGEEGLSLEEVVIPGESKLVGTTVLQSNLKSDYGVTIMGIKHAGERMTLNPEPTTVLKAGDVMILIGHTDQLEQLNKTLRL
jgi:voltage-gated potassium channel